MHNYTYKGIPVKGRRRGRFPVIPLPVIRGVLLLTLWNQTPKKKRERVQPKGL
jgi:hypothetical protein